MSIGFDRERERRQQAVTNNRVINGKYHVIFMLNVIFGLAEHQENATYRLSYTVTLTTNQDSSVLKRLLLLQRPKLG